jgi:phosphoglycolate phosphatase
MATKELTLDAELIVFDKDGTLVDLHTPWGQWAESVATGLAGFIPSEDLLSRLGWDATSERVEAETPLAIASLTTLQAVVATWLYEAGLGWSEAMATSERVLAAGPRPPASPICPLTPLFETLSARGYQLAVVSTDDLAGVERDLTPLGVLPYVSTIVAGDAALPTKPARDMVLAACHAVGVSPARTVVVGDSVADMLMGRAAKVALTIGVLSGSGTTEALSPHADMLVPTVCTLAAAEPGDC